MAGVGRCEGCSEARRERGRGNAEVTKAKPSLTGITFAYTSGKVSGSQFSGDTKIFVLPNDGLQVLYMISGGQDIWHGTYTGPARYWPEAENVIKGTGYGE